MAWREPAVLESEFCESRSCRHQEDISAPEPQCPLCQMRVLAADVVVKIK